MSIALALPLPQATCSLGRQWIAIHLGAQLICLATAATAYGVASLIGANDPAASGTLKQAAFGLAIATELSYALAFAGLRGAVIRQVVPGFPMRLWVVIVVGYLMVFQLLSGFSGAGSTAAPPAIQQVSGALILHGIAMAAIMGIVMGLVIGTLEALVLRRVGEGTAFWALCTAMGWSAGMVVVLSSGFAMMMGGMSGPALVLAGAGTKLALAMIVGFATLPALKQLRPRAEASIPATA